MVSGVLAALSALVVVLATGTGVAGAHAEVVETVPATGSSVAELTRIVVRFAEPVETAGSHAWLERPQDGATAPLAGPTWVAGDRRAVEMPVPSLEPGPYTARLHLVAADGDVVSVAIAFGLEAAAAPTPPPVDHPAELPTGIARVVLDAALASLIGGVAFVATVWPQGSRVAGARRLLWIAVVAAGLASLALVVAQQSAASGLGVVETLTPTNLLDALQLRVGRLAAFRVALLAVAAALTIRLREGGPSRQWSSAAAAVAVGLFETISLAGHDGGDAMSVASRFVHALGVSLWLGGLVMLVVVVLPRRRPDELAEVLPRFSRLATGAVGLVLLGGLALAVQLVGVGNALPTTTYGRALAVKLAVVAGLLLAAARARHHVRHRLADVGPTATGSIAAVVGVELGLTVGVLAATAVLLAQAPPR
jgi:putative copper export protein/methionine-rich copper-binding protein CopC